MSGPYSMSRWVYVDGGTEYGWFSDAERAEMDSTRTPGATYTWREITVAERALMNAYYTQLVREQG